MGGDGLTVGIARYPPLARRGVIVSGLASLGLVALAGCGGPAVPFDPDSVQADRIFEDSWVRIALALVTDKARQEKWFGTEQDTRHILPLFLRITNKSDEPLILDKDLIEVRPWVKIEMVENARPKLAEVALEVPLATALVIALPILFPASLIALPPAIAHDKGIQNNMKTIELRTAALDPGRTISGFLYIKTEKYSETLAGFTVRLPVKSTTSAIERWYEFKS